MKGVTALTCFNFLQDFCPLSMCFHVFSIFPFWSVLMFRDVSGGVSSSAFYSWGTTGCPFIPFNQLFCSCHLPAARCLWISYALYDIWIMNICDFMGSGAWCIVWVWIREKKVAPSFATKVSFAGTWPARPFTWTVELHSFSKMRERKTVVAWGCLVGSGAKLRKVWLSDAFSLGFQHIFLIWCWHILIICHDCSNPLYVNYSHKRGKLVI